MSKSKTARPVAIRTRRPVAEAFPFKEDIYARVNFMGPIAAKIIADGFDDDRCEWSEDLPQYEPNGLSDKQCEEVIRWASVTYAAGIAVGIRLSPKLFDRELDDLLRGFKAAIDERRELVHKRHAAVRKAGAR